MVALKRRLAVALSSVALLLLTLTTLRIRTSGPNNMRDSHQIRTKALQHDYDYDYDYDASALRPASESQQCRPVKYVSFDELSSSLRASTGERDLSAGPPPVTRILHQSWKTTQLPARFERWSRSWCECFPDWTHVLWSDADNERFVRSEYPWFLERFLAFKKNISRADSVRYLYLHRFGGLYADLDTICLRPFESLIESRAIVFGDMEARKRQTKNPHFYYVQNSVWSL